MSAGTQHVLSVTEPKAEPEIFAVTGPSSFSLGDWSIDEYKPMKIAVIGAGFSGILAGIRCVKSYLRLDFVLTLLAHRFRQYIQNASITVYEKNAGVGGTWYSNRYPYVPPSSLISSG